MSVMGLPERVEVNEGILAPSHDLAADDVVQVVRLVRAARLLRHVRPIVAVTPFSARLLRHVRVVVQGRIVVFFSRSASPTEKR